MAMKKNNKEREERYRGRPLAFKSPKDLEEKIEAFYEFCELNERPLTLSRLAVFLDVDRTTLVNYGEKDEYFHTIKKVKDRIQAEMEEKYMTGQSNVTASIFSFKNNYGWKDKIETENVNTNKNIDVSALTNEQLEQILKNE